MEDKHPQKILLNKCRKIEILGEEKYYSKNKNKTKNITYLRLISTVENPWKHLLPEKKKKRVAGFFFFKRSSSGPSTSTAT